MFNSIWSNNHLNPKLNKLAGMIFLALLMSACVSLPVDYDKATPLQLALGQGDKSNGFKQGIPDVKKVKKAVASGADVNIVNAFGSALHIASRYAPPEIVDYLVTHGANPNLKTAAGETPLMSAAQNGRFENVKILVEKGADVNAMSELIQWSPLSEASFSGRYDIVNYLISKGADVSKQSGMAFIRGAAGMRASMNKESQQAIAQVGIKKHQRTYEHIAILDLLRSKGADINTVSPMGETALHTPALSGNPQVVRYLLKIGVNPIICNPNLGTPLDFAQRAKEIHLNILKPHNPPRMSDKDLAAAKKYSQEAIHRFNEVITILTPVTNTLDSSGLPSTLTGSLLDQAKETLADCVKLKATLTLCEMLPKAAEIGCGLIARSQLSNSVCPV